MYLTIPMDSLRLYLLWIDAAGKEGRGVPRGINSRTRMSTTPNRETGFGYKMVDGKFTMIMVRFCCPYFEVLVER